MRLRTGILLLGCALVLVATSVTWAKPGSIFIPLGGTVSALLPDPSAPLIYVADQDNNRVLIIATEMGPTMTAVAVGPRPVGLALDPDGTTLYVAEQDSGTIGVIDVMSAQRVGSINVGVPPQAIATR